MRGQQAVAGFPRPQLHLAVKHEHALHTTMLTMLTCAHASLQAPVWLNGWHLLPELGQQWRFGKLQVSPQALQSRATLLGKVMQHKRPRSKTLKCMTSCSRSSSVPSFGKPEGVALESWHGRTQCVRWGGTPPRM